MTREEHIYQLEQYLKGHSICMCPSSSLYWKEHWEEVIKALDQEPTTKNNSIFCPDRKAKTTHMETFLHCVEDKCVAYKDGKCLKYNSDQEPTLKNDLGVDCISRADALDCVNWGYSFSDIYKKINELPSVTPQELRKGKWIIYLSTAIEDFYQCSECGRMVHIKQTDSIKNYPYCHCGAKMAETEET